MSFMCCVLPSTAPSSPPTSVSAFGAPTSIIVQWMAVDCIHRNGNITGYSVRYGVVGSAEGDRSVVIISEDFSRGKYVIYMSLASHK